MMKKYNISNRWCVNTGKMEMQKKEKKWMKIKIIGVKLDACFDFFSEQETTVHIKWHEPAGEII